jgi:hypothetical protein
MFLLTACGGVNSDREAELAWLGLDRSVDRAIELGLRGFSEADSANLATQTGAGEVSGQMFVDGQADQGASDNKGLRLEVRLEDYADLADVDDDGDAEVAITYDTLEGAPALFDLKLRGIPDGTFTGTVVGEFAMVGDLAGLVTLDLALTGDLEEDPEIEGGTRRQPGTLSVVGTATNDVGGVFQVDVTR